MLLWKEVDHQAFIPSPSLDMLSVLSLNRSSDGFHILQGFTYSQQLLLQCYIPCSVSSSFHNWARMLLRLSVQVVSAVSPVVALKVPDIGIGLLGYITI